MTIMPQSHAPDDHSTVQAVYARLCTAIQLMAMQSCAMVALYALCAEPMHCPFLDLLNLCNLL